MSDERVPAGVVTRTELVELAVLFDRFEFALDPRATDAKEAESEFCDRLRSLFDDRVTPAHPHLPFSLFYSKVKSACRTFLRKNPPT